LLKQGFLNLKNKSLRNKLARKEQELQTIKSTAISPERMKKFAEMFETMTYELDALNITNLQERC
jgi:hypothetical protein